MNQTKVKRSTVIIVSIVDYILQQILRERLVGFQLVFRMQDAEKNDKFERGIFNHPPFSDTPTNIGSS